MNTHFMTAALLISTLVLTGCATPSYYPAGQDPLDTLSVPPDWRLIKDYERYDVARDLPQRIRFGPQQVERCLDDITRFADISRNGDWIADSWCLERMSEWQGHPEVTQAGKQILLGLAERNEIIHSRADYIHYTYFAAVHKLLLFYAAEKPRMDLTAAEQQTIDNWFLDRARARLQSDNPSRNPPCTAMTPRMYIDDCGSTRQRYTLIQLVTGLVTGDTASFNRGIDSLKYVHRFVDDQGVYKGMAVRGGLAAHYHVAMTDWYSHYAEIMATLGVDYMNYVTPSGATIADSFAFTFSIVDDNNTGPLLKYAKMNKGNKGYPHTILENGPYRTNNAAGFRSRAARYFAEVKGELWPKASWTGDLQPFWDTRAIYLANRED